MRITSLVGAIFFAVGCIVLASAVFQTFIPSPANNTVGLDLTMIVSAVLVILGVWLYLRVPKNIEKR